MTAWSMLTLKWLKTRTEKTINSLKRLPYGEATGG